MSGRNNGNTNKETMFSLKTLPISMLKVTCFHKNTTIVYLDRKMRKSYQCNQWRSGWSNMIWENPKTVPTSNQIKPLTETTKITYTCPGFQEWG